MSTMIGVEDLAAYGERLDEQDELQEPIAPPKRRVPKRNRFLDKHGYYEPRPDGAPTTTRQGEALNLAIARKPSNHDGVANGVDATTNAPMFLDQFSAYGSITSNINVVYIGDIGKGKTSGVTTEQVLRQLPQGRQVVVFDKKLQAGRGEYTNVAEVTNSPSIRFTTGVHGGPRLNLLDPVISMQGDHTGAEVRPEGQVQLLYAVLADTMGRPLAQVEKGAVSNVLEIVSAEFKAKGAEPIIGALAERMLFPAPGDFDRFGIFKDEAPTWGRDCALALNQLSSSDLAGLVDAPTTPDVKAALNNPFVHFDVSGLPTAGAALRVVMTTTHTWLANRCAARSSAFEQTIQIFEEGWDVANGSTGALVQADMKLSRGLGLSTVSAFHHISDLARDSPARALMRESAIAYLYAQERHEDAMEIAAMYHLPPGSVDTLMRLPIGVCLVVVSGQDPILMRHIRSPLEVQLTNSDAAITGKAA